MTGRELIVYILTNGLEDEPVFNNGTFIGFKSIGKFAEEQEIGVAAVKTLVQMDLIDSVRVGDSIFIPVTAKHNIKKEGRKND